MATSWKQKFSDLADAVREERQARKTGGPHLREAVEQVNRLLDDQGDPPDPEEDTDQPA